MFAPDGTLLIRPSLIDLNEIPSGVVEDHDPRAARHFLRRFGEFNTEGRKPVEDDLNVIIPKCGQRDAVIEERPLIQL